MPENVNENVSEQINIFRLYDSCMAKQVAPTPKSHQFSGGHFTHSTMSLQIMQQDARRTIVPHPAFITSNNTVSLTVSAFDTAMGSDIAAGPYKVLQYPKNEWIQRNWSCLPSTGVSDGLDPDLNHDLDTANPANPSWPRLGKTGGPGLPPIVTVAA